MSLRNSESSTLDESDSRPDGRGLSSRAALWIGFLAGGWLATIAFVVAMNMGTGTNNSLSDVLPGLPKAHAEDPPLLPPILDPTNPGNGLGLPGSDTGNGALGRSRGIPNPGDGTSDSNNRAIALSASVGGGESAVYYFDTVAQRVLVYQYRGRLVSGDRPLRPNDRGGLRLLAARHIDLDLQLQGYRDLSEKTRSQLQVIVDAAKKGKKAPKRIKRPKDREMDIGK